MKLIKLIDTHKNEFDVFYKKLLYSQLSKEILAKAMIYGSMNGGKRIRPLLINIFSNFLNIKKKYALRLAASIESIHSYSLIHDDLPSMDNDDFRRGKPSTHKKFNEATAILAGDALHDLAFEILSNNKTHPDPNIRVVLINKLSKSIGFSGLAGGQSLDLLFENKNVSFSQIVKMYKMKTSSLFSFACASPYIMAKKNIREIKRAENFGNLFGLIFQITDDLLDEEKDFKLLGKTPGKDKKQGKGTLLSISNKQKMKDYCTNEIKNFKIKNKKFLNENAILEKLLYYNIERLN
tara:strand:+ start:1110 stop:1991 length:882 start_codon:yes stop_codon:yes gene_type:complete